MKVFLDTNVLVSAFTTRGLSADLFRLVVAEHELLTGEVNLTRRSTGRPLPLRAPTARSG